MMQPLNLKKELGFLEVFSIASGAMISSGLFVLPAIVFRTAGPAVIISYLLASLLILPTMLANAEMATAMPKSGGSYFFISRSLGPLLGTFAGFASWFSLSLKSAFALLGIGLFLGPLFPVLPLGMMIKIIALVGLLIFVVLNILSVRESGRFQVIFLAGLIGILLFYIGFNLPHIKLENFVPERDYGWFAMISSVGMIFVSFGGLTQIASMAEEIKNPRKLILNGMFAAYTTVALLYLLTVFITVGLLSASMFKTTDLPISLGAAQYMGQAGYYVLSLAAMLAFITTGNAGIMAASRDPLAMARDSLIPQFFSRVSLKLKTPFISILLTASFMAVAMIFLDLENLVKVASTMMLILFSLINLSVILMRESKIISYRPSFKAPLYPVLNILGIVFYLLLIIRMGLVPLAFCLGFFLFTLLWYLLYSKSRTGRDSALIQIVERITSREMKTSSLAAELRDILKELDQIVEDRFDKIIINAEIIDIEAETDLEGLFRIIARSFAAKFSLPEDEIFQLLAGREEISSTVIHTGLAIPHFVINGREKFDILVLRSKAGIRFAADLPLVNVIFALAGSKDERNFHLQALMAIAQIVQNEDFQHKWMKTRTTEDLRNLILIAQRIRKAAI